jgi:SpoVK/Ycf46/Vps4 family AAA+-type ATPase
MSEFIKLGDRIVAKPKGSDYDLIPGKTYSLEWDSWNDEAIIKENGEFNMPEKIYESKDSKFLKERVMNYFNATSDQNVGVMFAGEKGTGKSVDAKYLAQCSGLPIFIVNPRFPIRQLTKVFKKFESQVCIILDEVEKNWNTEHMLEFLDGVEKTCKKLVLMTCNDLGRVSQYMQDRCSRIRYLRKYTVKDNYEFLPFLLEQYDVTNKEEVTEFITNRMKLPSIDNMLALIKEVKLLEDKKYNIEMVAKFMNMEIIGEIKLPETPEVEEKPEIRNLETNEEVEKYFDELDNYEMQECFCAA